MTVYFNHLVAFNSSLQGREAASPAGQATGTAAPMESRHPLAQLIEVPGECRGKILGN